MNTLSILETRHKLKTQDIFRGKTVKSLVDHIDGQAAHIAELKATLQRMVTQFEGAAETQDDLDTLAEAKRVLK
jgi:protein-arginine kinase activator protein McsA